MTGAAIFLTAVAFNLSERDREIMRHERVKCAMSKEDATQHRASRGSKCRPSYTVRRATGGGAGAARPGVGRGLGLAGERRPSGKSRSPLATVGTGRTTLGATVGASGSTGRELVRAQRSIGCPHSWQPYRGDLPGPVASLDPLRVWQAVRADDCGCQAPHVTGARAVPRHSGAVLISSGALSAVPPPALGVAGQRV